MNKKKRKTAKVEYDRTLGFADSADSAMIKGKMEICKKAWKNFKNESQDLNIEMQFEKK
jgi:hypothetical protein